MKLPSLSPCGLFWVAYLSMITLGLVWGLV